VSTSTTEWIGLMSVAVELRGRVVAAIESGRIRAVRTGGWIVDQLGQYIIHHTSMVAYLLETDDSRDEFGADEVIDMTGVSRQALANHDGELQPTKNGRGERRYSRAALIEWLRARSPDATRDGGAQLQ
jgi:hypothetical protein